MSAPTVAGLRSLNRARVHYLLEIALGNGGPVLYLADADLTVEGKRYERYVQSVSGAALELSRSNSGGLNAELELRVMNDPWGGYAHLVLAGATYPFEGAPLTLSEVMMDDAGVLTEPEVVFRGVLEEPREIDLMGFTLRAMGMEFYLDMKYSEGERR